jgi:hypothetical protein
MALVETHAGDGALAWFRAVVERFRYRAIAPLPTPPQETRARLDFVLERLEAAPEAFITEEAIRGSMYFFSGRF